jgi:hypothetical protein
VAGIERLFFLSTNPVDNSVDDTVPGDPPAPQNRVCATLIKI